MQERFLLKFIDSEPGVPLNLESMRDLLAIYLCRYSIKIRLTQGEKAIRTTHQDLLARYHRTVYVRKEGGVLISIEKEGSQRTKHVYTRLFLVLLVQARQRQETFIQHHRYHHNLGRKGDGGWLR